MSAWRLCCRCARRSSNEISTILAVLHRLSLLPTGSRAEAKLAEDLTGLVDTQEHFFAILHRHTYFDQPGSNEIDGGGRIPGQIDIVALSHGFVRA